MAAAVFECRSVQAGYRSSQGPPHVVLHDVDFTLATQQVLVVLGASGSGKTTLLRLLNRFDEPLSGDILFEERPLRHADVLTLRRRVTLVPQTPTPFAGTVRDNLHVRPRGLPRPDEASMRRVLEEVGLSGAFLERSARQLSVGERQRLGIARALQNQPSVLLLDEPTSALDPQMSRLIAQLIDTLRRERHLSIVVVTHQAELANRLEGSTLLIADGTAHPNPAPRVVEAFLSGEETARARS